MAELSNGGSESVATKSRAAKQPVARASGSARGGKGPTCARILASASSWSITGGTVSQAGEFRLHDRCSDAALSALPSFHAIHASHGDRGRRYSAETFARQYSLGKRAFGGGWLTTLGVPPYCKPVGEVAEWSKAALC